MRNFSIPLVILGAFALAIGCDMTSEPSDDLDSFRVGEKAGYCNSDADCDKGSVCEPSGPSCLFNTCVPGCHEDTDCGAGDYCQELNCFTCPCPGECLPDNGCNDDDDCVHGTVCEPSGPPCNPAEMECIEGCHDDADCDTNEICDNVVCVTCPCPGQCIPDPTPPCKSDLNCPYGTVCEPSFPGCGTDEMECVPGCHDVGDCGPGEYCQTVYCFTCPCPGQCT